MMRQNPDYRQQSRLKSELGVNRMLEQTFLYKKKLYIKWSRLATDFDKIVVQILDSWFHSVKIRTEGTCLKSELGSLDFGCSLYYLSIYIIITFRKTNQITRSHLRYIGGCAVSATSSFFSLINSRSLGYSSNLVAAKGLTI